MREHGPLRVGRDENDARPGLPGRRRHLDRHAHPPHVLEEEPAQLVGGRLPGVRRLSAEVGDAEDRVRGRPAGTAMNGNAIHARENFRLRRFVDEGHRPFGKTKLADHGLADLRLNVDEGIAHP